MKEEANLKRDMELIRKIALLIEAEPSSYAPSNIEIEGYTASQIGYHCFLMVDSGLAEGHDMTCLGDDSRVFSLTGLTSAGHDFVESASNQLIWDEVRAEIKQKGFASVSIDMFKKLLDKAIRKRLDDF